MVASFGSGYPLPIQNTFVPQIGHVPCTASRPLAKTTSSGSCIGTFFRHFMQYAVSAISISSFINYNISRLVKLNHSRTGRLFNRLASMMMIIPPTPLAAPINGLSIIKATYMANRTASNPNSPSSIPNMCFKMLIYYPSVKPCMLFLIDQLKLVWCALYLVFG